MGSVRSAAPILATAIAFIASLLVTTVIVVNRLPPVRSVPEPPTRYMPGQPRPTDVACSWEFYDYQYVFCQATDWPGERLYLDFAMGSSTIEQTDLEVGTLTIGDLINAWGTPTAVNDYGYSIQIIWGNRSAWVYGRTFSPSSAPIFVFYQEHPYTGKAWHGFNNGGDR